MCKLKPLKPEEIFSKKFLLLLPPTNSSFPRPIPPFPYPDKSAFVRKGESENTQGHGKPFIFLLPCDIMSLRRCACGRGRAQAQ